MFFVEVHIFRFDQFHQFVGIFWYSENNSERSVIVKAIIFDRFVVFPDIICNPHNFLRSPGAFNWHRRKGENRLVTSDDIYEKNLKCEEIWIFGFLKIKLVQNLKIVRKALNIKRSATILATFERFDSF